jgi:hypothetical protein
MILTWEKLKYLEKNLSQCHFIHHKSHTDWPDSRRRNCTSLIMQNITTMYWEVKAPLQAFLNSTKVGSEWSSLSGRFISDTDTLVKGKGHPRTGHKGPEGE